MHFIFQMLFSSTVIQIPCSFPSLEWHCTLGTCSCLSTSWQYCTTSKLCSDEEHIFKKQSGFEIWSAKKKNEHLSFNKTSADVRKTQLWLWRLANKICRAGMWDVPMLCSFLLVLQDRPLYSSFVYFNIVIVLWYQYFLKFVTVSILHCESFS